MYEFQQLAAISLLSTYGHISQNQACFSLFYSLMHVKPLLKCSI